MTTGPTDICSCGPIRAASAPEREDRASMMNVTGSSAVPAATGGYACTTSRTVGRGELAVPEYPERQHRLRLSGLDQDDHAEQDEAHTEGHQHGGRQPAVGRGRHQPVG